MFWFHCPCCSRRYLMDGAQAGVTRKCPSTGKRVRVDVQGECTEAVWKEWSEPTQLLQPLNEQASMRKIRLLYTAFCAHRPEFEEFPVWRALLGALTRWAEEGTYGWPKELIAAKDWARANQDQRTEWFLALPVLGAHHGLIFGSFAEGEAEKRLHCDLIRDIHGQQFWRVKVAPAWLKWSDGTVPRIARAIYDECAFDRLPVLGDALEEAGCAVATILNHCRGPGPHVRGCWVVDALLGKS